ncbi:hypothetical protein [Cellulomonas sp. ATA003]|uniref:hypothetical protein n=1 Tax=Cellulomonas sp. ATA003 TaxID=3073064 RepID=UPI0028732A00|nr:hypothetical protein [Cellulomonas sp. ATA003]WNB85444.1 hypothetical protein REH70_17970 [Cellulomonas sp. ATA003]
MAVVNPDCRFERGSLAELRTEVLRHGSAIHGARFTSIDNPESGVVAVDKMTGKIVWADRHVDLVETWRKIPYVAGHFFATTRATWEDIGGLSEDFFLFAEEADLAIRNGVTNSRVADAVEVSHSRGASMSKESGALRSDAALFHSARSSMILFRKHKTLRRRLPIVAVARVAWAGAVAAKSRPRDGLTVLAGQLAGLRHRVGTSAYEQYRGDAQNALGRDATTRKRTSVRPPVVHVTWQRHAGRAVEIAHALGGEALHVHPSGLSRRPLVPIRYALSLAATVGGLLRLRPLSVIVTNPPVFPGLAVAAYSTLARAPFVLDSHPGSFGVKGNVVGRRLLGVTRWLARRAAAVMVTVDAYVELVESWGARGLVVHEAPPCGRSSRRP